MRYHGLLCKKNFLPNGLPHTVEHHQQAVLCVLDVVYDSFAFFVTHTNRKQVTCILLEISCLFPYS